MTYQVKTEAVIDGENIIAYWEEDSAGYPGDPAEGVILVEVELETANDWVPLNKHSIPALKARFHDFEKKLYGSRFEDEAIEDLHDLYQQDLY